MSAAGRMRPRGVGELLDAAIKLYLRHARTLIGLAIIVVVPLELLASIVLISTYNSGSDIPQSTGSFSFNVHPHPVQDPTALLGAQAILLAIQFLSGALLTAASVKAVSAAYLDQPARAESSLFFALRRLPALLALEILTAIGLGVATVLFVLPAVFLYGRWAVAMPAMLIEGAGPVRALGRSYRLVEGRWWPTAAVLLVAVILVGIVGFIVQLLLAAIANEPSQPTVVLSVTIACLSSGVGLVISNPFRATVTTMLYYDLRIRREAFDLQVLADRLGLDPGAFPRGEDDDGSSGGWAPDPETLGPESVGKPGGPPFWPPPPGWKAGQ